MNYERWCILSGYSVWRVGAARAIAQALHSDNNGSTRNKNDSASNLTYVDMSTPSANANVASNVKSVNNNNDDDDQDNDKAPAASQQRSDAQVRIMLLIVKYF